MLVQKQQYSVLREVLEAAQVRLKSYADTHRSEREFVVGDWVYLRLEPYMQVTVAIRKNLKLLAQYFGPYQIVENIGISWEHPVFHVFQLKKEGGQVTLHGQLRQVNEQGKLELRSLWKLDSRALVKDQKVVSQLLVQWQGCSVDEATWEDEETW